LAALVAGLLPAIRFSNPRLTSGLQSSERVGAGSNHLTRNALVVLQTAAALVLLVGSGLLLQSFRSLARVDPGYDIDDIFSFQTAPNPREHGLSDAPTFARFHYMFLERLAALPGVESVGLALTLPLDEGAGLTSFATDRTEDDEAAQALIRFTAVGGDYFQTMGIELLKGRYLERVDELTGQVDAIVSERAGRTRNPSADGCAGQPTPRRIGSAWSGSWRTSCSRTSARRARIRWSTFPWWATPPIHGWWARRPTW
jgi:putative ABC transport system permease protein